MSDNNIQILWNAELWSQDAVTLQKIKKWMTLWILNNDFNYSILDIFEILQMSLSDDP